MKKLILLPLLFISFAQAETIPQAGSIQCKVIGIEDGNTIICLTDQKEKIIKVGLYQIEAPEPEQAYWFGAKKALSDPIFNQIVRIRIKTHTKEERMLGSVYTTPTENCYIKPLPFSEKTLACTFRPKDINLELIQQGYAWYYPFDGENPEYQQAQEEAKKAKSGLWADPNPIPPWEWRKQKEKK